MKTKRFTPEEMVEILREAEARLKVRELLRGHGKGKGSVPNGA